MRGFLRRIFADQRGNALIITAAALPLVIGSAGLATDTVQWAMWKRQLQRSADSAALAGVFGIVQGQDHQAAVNRDLAINSHVGIATTTVVQRSPAGFSSDPYAVRVQLSVQKRLGFSSLFMSTPPTVTAAGTATVVAQGQYCVISLEPTTTTGLTYTGNAMVDMGCGQATNSIGGTAVDASGSSTIIASPIAAVGGIPASNNFAAGTDVHPYSMRQVDPFASINPPVPSGSCPNINVNTTETVSLSAGCYGNMTLNGTVTLGPGTYVLDAGSLSIGSQARVSCSGCVIILTSRTATNNPGSIGNVDINGGATVSMTAPTSGTYAGILFYQDRRALDGNSANRNSRINGNSSSTYQGAFYFPAQKITFNGTSGMVTNCIQMVARRVEFSGNTQITNVCPVGSGASSFDATTIRLVA